MIRTLGVFCVGLFAFLPTEVRANFVLNGGFEAPTVGSVFDNFGVGSTVIENWTVISGVNDPGSGSVDVYHGGGAAHSGLQVVDLDGTALNGAPAAGGISQVVSGLTVGSLYTLDFFYANNPNGSSSSALVTIGNLSLAITHSGSTAAALNYTEETVTFTATSNNLLSFASTDPSADLNGIFLDDVSIVPAVVPEPSSLVLSLLGGLGLMAHRRIGRRNSKRAM